jgi:hypothetical protein
MEKVLFLSLVFTVNEGKLKIQSKKAIEGKVL